MTDEHTPRSAPNDWTIQDGKLHAEYRFDDFAETLAFVDKVAAEAERMNHHPEIWFTYGRAVIEITTHEAGGLTEKDFELAEAIRRL